jgi:hypothetical protein
MYYLKVVGYYLYSSFATGVSMLNNNNWKNSDMSPFPSEDPEFLK